VLPAREAGVVREGWAWRTTATSGRKTGKVSGAAIAACDAFYQRMALRIPGDYIAG